MHNCPIEVAINEARLLSDHNYHLDSAVSIGTGCLSKDKPLGNSQPKDPPVKSFPRRVWDSFLHSIDTEPIWKRYEASLLDSDRFKYHRLNVTLKNVPALDDVKMVKSLREETREQFTEPGPARQQLQATARDLISKLFYIEIVKTERLSSKSRKIGGKLLCRLELKYQIKVVKEFLFGHQAFQINDLKLTMTDDTVQRLRSEKPFRMEFNIILPDAADGLSAQLLFLSSNEREIQHSHHISGSPIPLQRLVSSE